MTFRITGLSPVPFAHLLGLSGVELARHGVRRHVADSKPGYPDRIGLRDVEVGETVLLLNYTHQESETPYRASHAIFVAETPQETFDQVGQIPSALMTRVLSLRAFSPEGDMLDADLAEGDAVAPTIKRLLAVAGVAYLHVHFAKRGCYAARIERV